MPDLISVLESFNRKERFFLVAQALGNPKFELSPGFRWELGKTVGVPIPRPPEKVFVAMDYHLNWVHASLVLASNGKDTSVTFPYEEKLVKNNQEDIDLLVAFEDSDDNCHLIFVEAKAYGDKGFTHFKENQMKPKLKRLSKILENHRGKSPQVVPHLCLISGYKQRNLKTFALSPEAAGSGTPTAWLELKTPGEEKLVVKLPNRDGSAYISKIPQKSKPVSKGQE